MSRASDRHLGNIVARAETDMKRRSDHGVYSKGTLIPPP